MKITAVLGGLLALALASPASACEEFYEVDNAQGKQLVETLKNPEADEFDQVIAFDTLICAKRVALRNIALRYGRTAASPDVRAQVLQTALFRLPRLVVNLRPEEGLSRAARDFIQANPSIDFTIGERSPEMGCMNLLGDKGCAKNSLQIVGTKAQINYSFNADINAEFELTRDGKLTGWYLNKRDRGVGILPAEIVLQ
ncbi:MAG: hypothetical protein ACFBSD_13060 [Paracoccaceae bacterium]